MPLHLLRILPKIALRVIIYLTKLDQYIAQVIANSPARSEEVTQRSQLGLLDVFPRKD